MRMIATGSTLGIVPEVRIVTQLGGVCLAGATREDGPQYTVLRGAWGSEDVANVRSLAAAVAGFVEME